MFDRIEQSTVRQMKDNVLKRDVALLPKPDILFIAPVVRLHEMNISRCVRFGNSFFRYLAPTAIRAPAVR
jgi:hypothetical protein